MRKILSNFFREKSIWFPDGKDDKCQEMIDILIFCNSVSSLQFQRTKSPLQEKDKYYQEK